MNQTVPFTPLDMLYAYFHEDDKTFSFMWTELR